ncbi:glycosyltransferase family 2 protein [Candidatus Woesearchaeota archaeon]|nr:glycosyltransferase family 2 protein [Candidatus Woesearchaeota archaeon]
MIVSLVDMVLYSTYFFLLFFAIFWLLVIFSSEEKEKKTNETKKLSHYPYFTAIVPAYNEEEAITETLQSLVNLDYPKDKREIIIVNDGSQDKTKELVEQFISRHPDYKIILLNQKNQGKGRAMNNGLSQAKSEFFACLDADSFVAPNALQEMLPYFMTDTNIAAVCPLLKVKKPSSIIQKIQWVEYTTNMLYKMLNAKLDCIHVTPGPFSIYRTEVIKKLGGYNEKTITEDLEIAIRLQKHHYRIIQTFNATVETIAPNNWKDLFWQRIRWYKGSVENTINYRKLMFNREYGDFGYLRMPTIIFSGVIAIVLSLTLLRELMIRSYHSFLSLSSVNFDIFTLIEHASLNINILSMPFSKYLIALTLFSISLFMMINSYKVVNEKITNHGRTFTTFAAYLLIYGLFLTAVWIYIAILFVKRKENKW